jgi:hypothetical protein
MQHGDEQIAFVITVTKVVLYGSLRRVFPKVVDLVRYIENYK